MAKPALGRGLGALLGDSPIAKPPGSGANHNHIPGAPAATDPRERVQRVALDRIRPCPLQPRKDFSPETLRELADSIKEQGIVQPLIVRERDGHLELIAGERRWRAAQLLGLAEVPVILRQADDRAVLELALIENLQRENLNAMEEAHGYSQLIEQFQLKQEEVATKVGKSRAVVANALRLLKLPPSLQASIREGRLSVGHAKVILGLASEQNQRPPPSASSKKASTCARPRRWSRVCWRAKPAPSPKPGQIPPLTARRPRRQPGEPAARASGDQGPFALCPGQRRPGNHLLQRRRA